MTQSSLRDNRWLQDRVRALWNTYYSDARTGYPIVAKFGPRARYRYGSIYSCGETCYILINRLFAHPDVPEYVIDATLCHELAHYVHGWGSGLPKLFAHPHRNGVVDKEMEARGCYEIEERAGAWRKAQWQDFYASQAADTVARRAAREKREQTQWEMYLSTPGFRTEEQLRQRLAELAQAFGQNKTAFEPTWLFASIRRNGLSYRFRRENSVRLHATLADPAVPQEVVDYELSYWLAVEATGGKWEDVESAMRKAGVWQRAQKAIQWRRKVWPHYYVANHPLKTK